MTTLRGRRWPGTVGAVAVPAVLVGLALVYPGARVSQVDLNDGAVWITNTGSHLVGRLNAKVGEINDAVTAEGAAFDVHQDAQWVLVEEGAKVFSVDPADVVAAQEASIPADSSVSMARGVVSVLDAAGQLWVRSMEAVSTLGDPLAGDLALGAGSGAVVSRTSGVVLAVTSDGVLHTVLAEGVGSISDTVVGPLAGEVAGVDAITAVGDVPVVLDGSTLHTPDAVVELGTYGSDLTLQQPGPAADSVLVATPTALVEVPLAGGDPEPHTWAGSGRQAAPVRVGACGYAAWAAGIGSTRMRLCGSGAEVEPLSGVPNGTTLTFRVNRDVVVLNDTRGGTFWTERGSTEAQRPDWDAFEKDQEPADGDQPNEDASNPNLQAECTDQSGSPKAVDDHFGVRAGRTQILSVIDNDVSSDCGVLTILQVDQLPESFGSITPIYGGRALQLVVNPRATGTLTFTYTIGDGRGSTAPSRATVTLDVRGQGENEAPVQLHVGRLVVEAGATASYHVLPDFEDPDGDQLVLLQATGSGTSSVRVRQDGTLTFTSDGVTLGEERVQLLVSDGTLTVTGELVVDVRQAGSVVPQIDPVHAVAYVGEPVTIDVLSAVRSASQEPVRLVGVQDQPGVTITTDLDAGTFTFTAARTGPYYVSFQVTAAPQQATGLARIDVIERTDVDPTPVAVLDVALLPALGEVVIDPLANDTDPLGKVLVLTAVDPPIDSGVQVAVLGHQLVRITAPTALSGSVSVPYTISNGDATATGEIRVKPIAPETGQQPPVVPDATATVRTGGVVTIPVLDKAYDPDGDPLTVVPTLVEAPGNGQGLAFVSGDVVRFQAPATPMTVTIRYGVTDGHDNTTTATATVSVHPSDPAGKSAPRPKDLTARVFQNETIRIPVPLTGIDPDGDGVTLLGIASAAGLGQVQAGADYLEYTSDGGVGTDTFTYAVEDWTGQRSVATVRVGIAARPQGSAQVVARDDEVSVRPGQQVSVRVLANDVDNSGDGLTLEDPLISVPEGVEASIEDRRIVVQAPDTPAELQIIYAVTNNRGGRDTAALQVHVRTDAPILVPIARDVVVPASATLNAASVEVDVLEVAENPSGPLSDLEVSVDPSAAGVARVTPSGTVEVTLGPNPQTIPYVLTNTSPVAGGAHAYAFITVPALGDFPPVRRPNAPALEVYAGEVLRIDLAEQVQVAPGRTAVVNDRTSVSASHSDGSSLWVSREELSYTALRSYSGAASITFLVSDGPAGDPTARSALLTVPITVYAYEDYPPTFEPSVLDVAPGESASVDLSAFVEAPVTRGALDLSRYTYTLRPATPAGVQPVLDGSTLTLQAGESVPRGTVGSVGLLIDYGGASPLQVAVDYRVVASQRPLASVFDQTLDAEAGRATKVDVLAGSVNPFVAELRVVDAVAEGGSDAAVSLSGDVVTITPPTGYVGPLVVRFRVRDATNDPGREVDGRITLVVRDVPAAPTAPRISEVGDKTVTLAWDAPAANGEPITGYKVTAEPGGAVTQCPGTTCAITGLTNDQQYTFTVVATNAVGDSQPSPTSPQARPDAKPAAPATPTADWGDAQVTVRWTAPANTGSPIKDYQIEISPAPPSGPAVVTTNSTSYTFTGLTNGTAYIARVRATNAAPDPGDWSTWSSSAVPAGKPTPPGNVSTSGSSSGGGWRMTVSWTASAPNGDPVARYEVQVDGVVSVVDASSLSYSFDAERGVKYQIDVRAVNKAGPSAWASTTGEIWTSPSQVRNLQLTDVASNPTPFGAGALRASWSTPTDNGGVALDGYRITLDGSVVVETTGRNYTFTGLSGGEHSVDVVAINVRGAVSEPVSATASTETVPQRPVPDDPDLSIPFQVTFSWAVGGDGGLALEGWRYEVSSNDVVIDGGTVTSPVLVVTGTAGQEVTVVVWAVNAEGESTGSVPVSAIVPDDPGGGGG